MARNMPFSREERSGNFNPPVATGSNRRRKPFLKKRTRVREDFKAGEIVGKRMFGFAPGRHL
jgi:hypothetical protein